MVNIIHEFNIRIRNIGKIPLCNKKPERAPHIFNVCFPLCWRCSATVFSYTMSRLFISNVLYEKISFTIALILLLPIAVDSILQYKYNIISTNFRRIVTGLLAGVGILIIEHQLFNNILEASSLSPSKVAVAQHRECALVAVKICFQSC